MTNKLVLLYFILRDGNSHPPEVYLLLGFAKPCSGFLEVITETKYAKVSAIKVDCYEVNC